jgi:hypothetical protein
MSTAISEWLNLLVQHRSLVQEWLLALQNLLNN